MRPRSIPSLLQAPCRLARQPQRRNFAALCRQHALRPALQRPVQRLRPDAVRTQHTKSSGNLSNWFRNFGLLFRRTMSQKPFETSAALIFTLSVMSYATYWFYLQLQRIEIDYGGYPEQVGVQLRRALYYTDHNWEPKKAAAAFAKAIKAADAAELHQCTDAVIGINIELARFVQKNGDTDAAIRVLEKTRSYCMDYIEKYGNAEGQEGNRRRLLQKSIQLAMRIGELYADPSCKDGGNPAKAEEYLVWSVQTGLQENQKMRKAGLKPEEALIISADEQGAQLETLGHFYEEKNNFYYASQLFLQAINLKQTVDCHTVVLMNNLAAAIAQQVPVTEPGVPPPSPAQLRESASAWSKKALELSRSIKPPVRNEECDVGCVAATHTLGEFAEMDGRIKEARELYEEAGSLAHALGFTEGVEAADQGIARIDGGKPRKRYPLRSQKPETKGWFSF